MLDNSEVTLNVCLGKQFQGGTLYFEGVRCAKHQSTPSKEGEHFVYSHTAGRAVIHVGRHRHGANELLQGERFNLVSTKLIFLTKRYFGAIAPSFAPIRTICMLIIIGAHGNRQNLLYCTLF